MAEDYSRRIRELSPANISSFVYRGQCKGENTVVGIRARLEDKSTRLDTKTMDDYVSYPWSTKITNCLYS